MGNPQVTHQLDHLTLPPAVREALKGLLGAFGIDERFTAYQGIVADLLGLLRETDNPPPAIQSYWDRAAELMEYLGPKLPDLPQTDARFSEEYKTDYRILSALHAKAGESELARLGVVKRLLLGGVLVGYYSDWQESGLLDKAAFEIQQAHGDPNRLSVVPDLGTNRFDEAILRTLYQHLTSLEKQGLDQRVRRFAKRLERLCTLVLDAPQCPAYGLHDEWTLSEVAGEADGPVEDMVPIHGETVMGFSESGKEFPEPEFDQDVVEGNEVDRDLSDAGFSHRARMAHFLGRQWRAPYRWGRGGATPLDESRMAQFFECAPELVESGGAMGGPEAMALLALVGATSRDLPEILQWQAGPEGTVRPGGSWHRHITLPEGAYSQPEGPAEAFHAVTTELALPLPQPCAALMAHWVPDGGATQPLWKRMGIDPGDEKAMEQLRETINRVISEKINARLTLKTLRPMFRNTVHRYTGCEVTTYCLFGDVDRQLPPIGLFYYSLPVDHLIQVYQTAGARLFGTSDAH